MSYLVYLNNRHHDPTLGQFISVDPLVTMTGEPYIYGAANPVTFSDPSGLCIAGGQITFHYEPNDDGGLVYTGWSGTAMRGPECSPVDAMDDGGEYPVDRGHGDYDNEEQWRAAQTHRVSHGPGGSFEGLSVGDILTWDNAATGAQVALVAGTFTPCSAWCAAGAAGISTGQAVDTCSEVGWGGECGLAAGGAAVAWAATGSFVVARGSQSLMGMFGDDATAMAARATATVGPEGAQVGSFYVATRGVLSSTAYFHARRVYNLSAPLAKPLARLDLVFTGANWWVQAQ